MCVVSMNRRTLANVLALVHEIVEGKETTRDTMNVMKNLLTVLRKVEVPTTKFFWMSFEKFGKASHESRPAMRSHLGEGAWLQSHQE